MAISALLLGPVPPSAAGDREVPAFPGAEGFGAGATGGRGGSVVFVDTLEPFGPGSLGEALAPESCEPRIVVFRVSGVIEVPGKHDLELRCGDVTIAGQTAPGAGITVHGRIDAYGADPAGNIIIRHLRLRPPPLTDEEGAVDDLGSIYDSLQLSNNSRVVLDHVSLSWASDEVLDLFENASDVTVQWSTIEESSPRGQPEGPHNYGLIAGPDSPRVSVHHVLFAHHRSRCPALAAGPAELINSVVYDCQDGFVHHNPAEGEFHIALNTFIQGPSHEDFAPFYFDDEEPGDTSYWLFQNDVRAPGQLEEVVDDISGTPLAEIAFTGADPGQVVDTGSDFTQAADGHVPISMQTPSESYEAVLSQAGAFPRDAVTNRTVDDVREGAGSWDVAEPGDLLEGLSPAEPPTDSDDDGMADEWEVANGLDPEDGEDHATVMESGYTAIEEYVNELSDRLVGAEPPEATVSPEQSGNRTSGDTDDETAAAVQSVESGDGDASELLALAAAVLSAVAAVLAGYAVHLLRQRPHEPPESS